MLYFVRMTLSIFFGVISVFMLLFAIEFHREVNDAYSTRLQRIELMQASGNDAVAPLSADKYYRSMLGTIGFKYGIAGVFLILSAASFIAIGDGRNRSAADSARVYGPEDK